MGVGAGVVRTLFNWYFLNNRIFLICSGIKRLTKERLFLLLTNSENLCYFEAPPLVCLYSNNNTHKVKTNVHHHFHRGGGIC